MKLVRTIVTGEPCNVCGYMGEHICSNVVRELTSMQEFLPSSPNETLIAAMYILANDIESEDGIANAAILEAAQRLRAFLDASIATKAAIQIYLQRSHDPIQKSKLGDAIKMLNNVISA